MQSVFQSASSVILTVALLLWGVCSSFAQGLPGGATSLNETHGDWTVACATPEDNVWCAVSQVQINSENRQRVLSVELTAMDGGNAASGTFVMPFGLALDQGVVLSIGEGEPLAALRFSTCFPSGCLVPFSFDASMISIMRASAALTIKAMADGSGQELTLPVSLHGFSSALARASELSEP